jgi:hypothetical protein
VTKTAPGRQHECFVRYKSGGELTDRMIAASMLPALVRSLRARREGNFPARRRWSDRSWRWEHGGSATGAFWEQLFVAFTYNKPLCRKHFENISNCLREGRERFSRVRAHTHAHTRAHTRGHGNRSRRSRTAKKHSGFKCFIIARCSHKPPVTGALSSRRPLAERRRSRHGASRSRK